MPKSKASTMPSRRRIRLWMTCFSDMQAHSSMIPYDLLICKTGLASGELFYIQRGLAGSGRTMAHRVLALTWYWDQLSGGLCFRCMNQTR